MALLRNIRSRSLGVARSLCIAGLLAWAGGVQAEAPAGYYDAALGLSGSELKNALHNIIKDHTVYPYSSTATDTSDLLKIIEEDPGNPDNVLLHYKGTSVAKSSFGTAWNREHTWPQSLGADVSPKESDLHALFAEDVSLNSSRGNSVYNYVANPTNSAYGNKWTGSEFEPRDAQKGDVARAILYMDVRYDGTGSEGGDLTPLNTTAPSYNQMGVLDTLLAWHSLDPPDDAERTRNDRVYSFQNNRNPFVDNPDYVALIYQGGTVTVHDGDTVSVSATNRAAATVAPGASNVALLTLTLNAASNEWDLASVQLANLGTLADNQISEIRLYRDADNSASVTTGDTLLASTSFASGAATLTLASPARVGTNAAQFLLTANVANSAPADTTLQIRVAANGLTHAASGGNDLDPATPAFDSTAATVTSTSGSGSVKIVCVSTRSSAYYGANASAEYIVLANESMTSVNLSGWSLKKVNGPYTLSLSGTIPAWSHFLIASNSYSASDVEGISADLYVGSTSILNGLSDSSATAIGLFNGTTKVDGFSWGGSASGDTSSPTLRDGTAFSSYFPSSTDAQQKVVARKRPGGTTGPYTDTDNNASDLEIVTVGTPKTPLNSSTGLPAQLSSFRLE